MKGVFFILCAVLSLPDFSQAQNTSHTICTGANLTLFSPYTGLQNPTYSVNPGGITNTLPWVTVTPTANTTYTLYSKGLAGSTPTVYVSTHTVTVTSDVAPTFTLSPSGPYTLGCASFSALAVTFTNANTTPSGGAISYSVYIPLMGSLQAGVLSTVQSYTMTYPSLYMMVAMDNFNGCRNSILINVKANTLAPSIDSLIVPTHVLDCATTSVALGAQTTNTNATFTWYYLKTSSVTVVQGNSVVATTQTLGAPNVTLAGTYTAVLTDNSNGCKSSTLVPIYQNLFKPSAIVSGQAQNITCATPSVQLTNYSKSNVPVGGFFPTGNPVIATLWRAPGGDTLVNSSTYVATQPGNYTMTVMDMNNFCTASTVTALIDGRDYPVVLNDWAAFFLCQTPSASLMAIMSNTMSSLTYTWIAPAGATVSGVNSQVLTATSAGQYTVLIQNDHGCITQATFIVDQCTGLSELDNNNLKVYPNPAHGIVTICGRAGEQIALKILDTDMRACGSVEGMSPLEFDMSRYESGVYFIEIISQKGRSVGKVVKD